jgi:short-subunit dehydrogenase
MQRYANALVTGGAHGIGRAIACALVAEGVDVAVLDVDGAAARESARAIAGSGGRCVAVEADLRDAAQLASALARVEEALGKSAEILVNNAGVVIAGQFADTTVADSMAQIDVSVICPGVIRTGIAERTGFRGVPRSRIEHIMSIGVPPERVARAVLRAIRCNRAVTVVTAAAAATVFWYRHFPRSFRYVTSWVGKVQRREIAAARGGPDAGG